MYLLGLLPELIHFSEAHLFEFTADGSCLSLDMLKTLDPALYRHH